MRKIQIGVIGFSSCSKDVFNIAVEVGKEIANSSAILICGGRGGVMEGASKGSKEAGGLVVGILPGINEKLSDANPYLDVSIPTNMGWTRNSLVALASDGLIIIGGKSGTLSEISFGWQYDKPLVALSHSSLPKDSWGVKLIGESLDDRRKDAILGEESPKAAVKNLISQIQTKNIS